LRHKSLCINHLRSLPCDAHYLGTQSIAVLQNANNLNISAKNRMQNATHLLQNATQAEAAQKLCKIVSAWGVRVYVTQKIFWVWHTECTI